MQKIKKGDIVIVITGKDKGKKGTVLSVIYSGKNTKQSVKAIVQNVNLIKKHKKGDPSQNIAGTIITREAPISISNLALINPSTNKPDKVGFKFIEKDQVRMKVRYFKSNQEVIDVG